MPVSSYLYPRLSQKTPSMSDLLCGHRLTVRDAKIPGHWPTSQDLGLPIASMLVK